MIEIQELKFVKNSLHEFDHILSQEAKLRPVYPRFFQQHTVNTVMSTGSKYNGLRRCFKITNCKYYQRTYSYIRSK